MKKILQITRISLALVMSVVLFSCETSELDSLVSTANAATPATSGAETARFIAKKSKADKIKGGVISEPTPAPVDTAYIVSFFDPNNLLTTQTQVENLATSIGGSITFDQVYWEGTKGFAAVLTVAQANAFRADSRVEFVEVDGPITPMNP